MERAKKQKNSLPVTEAIIQHEEQATKRLNKFISDSGYCSRRQADRLIEAEKVEINGQLAELGQRVRDGDQVQVEGQLITEPKNPPVYLALNKPVGITSTTDQEIPGNLTDFLNYPEMIFPIGRLDKDSSGLILLTNDGDIVNKILREEYGHPKEYHVRVNRPLSHHFLKQMGQGVEIYNPVANRREKTKKCFVEALNNNEFKIVLKQGLNRQIRRMVQALDYKVTKLERVKIMNIELNDLKVGQWRYLTKTELIGLNQAIQQATKS